MAWPPRVGELLPRADEAIGVRDKLEKYSLNRGHSQGGGKAKGFVAILGITAESIDYLEAEIYAGVLDAPVTIVRETHRFGYSCAVDLTIQGIGPQVGRAVRVRTAWQIHDARATPRLTSAYVKP